MMDNTQPFRPPIEKWSFEYLYVIIMVIYACKLTPETSRMSYGMTWDIPFFIPIILSIVLILRNHINFKNDQLQKLIRIVVLWIFAITIKLHAYYIGFQSYNFFLIYGIIIAYVHIQVYGIAFPDIYEDVMVLFAKISLPLWLFGVLSPGGASAFFHLFPSFDAVSAKCYHVFYLYNWFDHDSLTTNQFINLPRNSGPAFEPGYFASMLCLAILNNVSRYGLILKGNRNLAILLLTLITTFSTTGYSVALVIFAMYYLQRGGGSHIAKIIFVIVPIALFVLQLDFMGGKIEERANLSEINQDFYASEAYNSTHKVSEFHSSLDRFQSLYFEWENILKDPILGYSRDVHKSWFGQTFMSNYSLTGGLLKTLGQFGLLLGAFLYWLLFKSSKQFNDLSCHKSKYALVVTMLLISISYGYFGAPIFMTFWLLGAFGDIPNRSFCTY